MTRESTAVAVGADQQPRPLPSARGRARRWPTCRLGACLCGAATALLAGPADAQPVGGSPGSLPEAGPPVASPATGLERCIGSFEGAQRLRRAGKLISSREALVRCAQPSCPVPITSRCMAWLGEVDQAIPTMIVTALDPAGHDTSAVAVWVDGELRARALDGRPWRLDPGPHLLRFEHAASRPIERRLVVAETEKNRRLELWFEPLDRSAPAASAEPADEPMAAAGVVAWTAASVGAAALIAGVVTGALALDARAELDASCAGGVCRLEDAERYRDGTALARASTVSLVGAGVGLSVGLLTWLLGPEAPFSPQATARGSSVGAAVALGVGPGSVSFGGRLP